MKNIIARRIIVLMSIAILISSVLIVVVAVILADGLTLLTIKRYIKAIVMAILIVIPIIVGLSYIVLKRIIRPFRNIAKVAVSLMNGDYSIRADESLKGEIGYLGRTMNNLSIDLYKNISQLFVEKNRLYQVLSCLDESMLAVDENKKITHFNKVLLEKFSLTEESIMGVSVDEIEFFKKELSELEEAIQNKEPIIKNCSYKDSILKVIIAPIENEKKQSVGAVALFRDITEHEKLEIMRKNYVANVSHELRSPLTSIRALIEPLMDSVVSDEEDVKRYYNIIYKESLRLSRLVDDIMELSRLQTNEANIVKRKIDLRSVLEMVYERYVLFDEGIELIYHKQELPFVMSNYDRIEQILVILVDNAFKFTPKGGQIQLSTKIQGDHILVRVQDSGIGIKEEDLPFVFDRFYKSDKPRTKKGTGLGLSIAREILTIMDETITVKSIPDQGSTFEFSLHF